MSMKICGVVARVRRVAVAGLVGHVGQRTAHLAVDRVGRQERLGVHRVEVVDAVEERRLDAVRAQRAGDRVEDDRPAQAADVDGPGRRLRVVDDLGAASRTRVASSSAQSTSPPGLAPARPVQLMLTIL